MKKGRESYIRLNEEKTLIWPIITVSALALVLVLIILLTFSMFDSIKGDMNRKIIDSKLTEATAGLAKDEQDRKSLQVELAKLKEEVKDYNTIRNFTEDLNTVKNIEVQIANRLKKRLIDKKLINDPDANVYISPKGNLTLSDSYIFEPNNSVLSSNGQKILEHIASELESIMKENSLGLYVEFVEIQSHMANAGVYDAKNIMLSTQRASGVLNFLFEKSAVLRDTYYQKFISTNMLNTRLIDSTDSKEAEVKNKRMEIAVLIDPAAYQAIVEKYSK